MSNDFEQFEIPDEVADAGVEAYSPQPLQPPAHRRDEGRDIPHLVEHFLSRNMLGKHSVPISDEAMTLIKRYPYPGNMRELKNIIERAALLARGSAIQPEHLPKEIRRHDPALESRLHQADMTAPDQPCHCDEDASPELIQRTLMRFQGNRRKTAAFLNISERALYRRLKMLGSAPPNT